MEVEYMTISHDVIERIWLSQLLEDIGVVQIEAILMEYNYQRCLTFTNNLKHLLGTKYINIKYHFVKKKIDIKYCALEDMFINLLTKILIIDRYYILIKILVLKAFN